MTKIVINVVNGGYSLSKEIIEKYKQEKGITGIIHEYEIHRDDPILVGIVEQLDNDNASITNLQVVEIPDDVDWQIEEYDGAEWVSEVHRTWEYEGK